MNTIESTTQPASRNHDYYKHIYVLYAGKVWELSFLMDLSCADRSKVSVVVSITLLRIYLLIDFGCESFFRWKTETRLVKSL